MTCSEKQVPAGGVVLADTRPGRRADHEDALGLVQVPIETGIANGDLAALDPATLARAITGALMEATLHVLGPGNIDDALAVIGHLIASLAPAGAPHPVDG